MVGVSIPLPIMASSWTSFNPSGCSIPSLGEVGGLRATMGQFHHHCPPVCPQTLFVWCGARSNVLERSRAQELAAAIRDSERGGKARLEIVADGEEPPEMVQVCPHWAERGTWVSLGWLRDPPSHPLAGAGPQAPLAGGQP